MNKTNIKKQYKFYNYIYLDPRKPGKYTYEGLNFSLLYEPFYVGKGSGNRKYRHINNFKGKSYMVNKIKSLTIKKYNIKYFILQVNRNLLEYCALELERYLIKCIGRKNLKLGPLANLTDGGEGISGVRFKNRDYKGNNNPQSKFYLINVKGMTEAEVEEYLKNKALKGGLLQQNKNLSSQHKLKISKALKGKTYEEIMGEEKAKEVKIKKSLSQKGKSFEERYGDEKAKEIKEILKISSTGRIKTIEEKEKRRKTLQENKALSGKNNPSAKKYVVINHNNNTILYCHGTITKYCTENNISLFYVKYYLNKGKITLDMLSRDWKDSKPRSFSSFCNKYLGFEFKTFEYIEDLSPTN